MSTSTPRTLLGIALIALTASALPAAADLYVGFGSGRSNLDSHLLGSSDEFNGDDTSEQFFFGLELGRHASLEFGRTDFGVLQDTVMIGLTPTTLQYAGDGRTISLLFREEIFDDVALFVRAGVVDWDRTIDDGSTLTWDSGQNGVFGFGATFQAGRHIAFRAEYTQYELGDEDVMLPSLAVSYTF